MTETAAEWTLAVLDFGQVNDDGHWHWDQCAGPPCNCIKIENEMSDYRMILDHCTTVYYEVSGGRVSKPNTLPDVVLDFWREDQQKYVDECIAEAQEG